MIFLGSLYFMDFKELYSTKLAPNAPGFFQVIYDISFNAFEHCDFPVGGGYVGL
jgi:hypothetical protein